MRYFGQPRIFGQPLGVGSRGMGFAQYVASLNPSMWLPLTETSGTNAADISGNGIDGTYINTPTLAGATLLGQPAPVFASASSQNVQLDEVSLDAVFDADLGSMMIALNASTAVWATAAQIYFMNIGVDNSNRVGLIKPFANTIRLAIRYDGNGANSDYTVTAGDKDLWILAFATWNKSANRQRLYVKTTVDEDASATGNFTGTLTSAFTGVGGLTGGAFMDGALGTAALWTRELTASETAKGYTLFSSQEPNAAR